MSKKERELPDRSFLSDEYITLIQLTDTDPDSCPHILSGELNMYDQLPFSDSVEQITKLISLSNPTIREGMDPIEQARRTIGYLANQTHKSWITILNEDLEKDYSNKPYLSLFNDQYFMKRVKYRIPFGTHQTPDIKPLTISIGWAKNNINNKISQTLIATADKHLSPYPYWWDYLINFNGRNLSNGDWRINFSQKDDIPSYIAWSASRIVGADMYNRIVNEQFIFDSSPHLQTSVPQFRSTSQTGKYYNMLRAAGFIQK